MANTIRKFNHEGIPVCMDCGKKCPAGHSTWVNQKTLEDYFVCSWCDFKRKDQHAEPVKRQRAHGEVLLEKKARKLKRLETGSMTADLLTIDYDLLKKIRNTLACRFSRELDPSKKGLIAVRLEAARKMVKSRRCNKTVTPKKG